MFYVFSRTGSQFESFSTLISTLSLQAAAVSTKLLPFTHVVHVQCADRLTALTSPVTHLLTPQNSLALPRVATYMSCVEVFATEIRIESSDQSPFLGGDQGIKVISELLKLKNQQCMATI